MSTHDTQTPIRRAAPKHLKLKAFIAALTVTGVVVTGFISRHNSETLLAQDTLARALPTVKTILPSTRQGADNLALPGTLQAYYSASVYARVSGYLKHWAVDIGTPVKSGQVMADIETPELDQQLKQAEADLEIAIANEHLTDITSKRWQHLLLTDSVSQQEADEKNGDYAAKKALVAAAQAGVNRLQALESFKRITAPFNGVVTSRKTDVGALINAGHETGHELFTVADVHRLRLYVNVPQNYADQIEIGMKAELEVPERPGQIFNATLMNSSNSVSEATGTILIEFDVDNSNGNLLPGEFGTVHINMRHASKLLQIPASALAFRKEGMSVLTLTKDNSVVYRPIKISQDLGSVIEVASGISANDKIIDSPPESLENGDKVNVMPTIQVTVPSTSKHRS